jgi:hypothetical protein
LSDVADTSFAVVQRSFNTFAEADRHHRPRAGGGMMITREFCPGDRYNYDFGLCSGENGWA